MPRREVSNSSANRSNRSHRKYRSKTEITRQILSIVIDDANNGHYHTNKTKLMYKAMLSYSQLKDYLPVLVESGLLNYQSDDDDIYKITDKGKNFLRIYNHTDEFISI